MCKWIKCTRKKPRIATYPACDHLNIALHFLLDDPERNKIVIEEICHAIVKSGGYYSEYVANHLVFYGFGDFVKEEMVNAAD